MINKPNYLDFISPIKVQCLFRGVLLMPRVRYLVKKHYSVLLWASAKFNNRKYALLQSLDDWDPQIMAKEIHGTVDFWSYFLHKFNRD
jgi:hypothetical protein